MAHYDYDTCAESDCPLCLAIADRALPATDAPVVELGYMVVDAITRLNDKIDNLPTPTSAVDLTPVNDQFVAERTAVDQKLDSFAAAVDAKLAALPAATADADLTDYSTTEDAQAYADQAAADALTDAQTYTDGVKDELVEQIAQSHDDVVQLVIEHAVPAAAAAAAIPFDPTVLDPIRTAFTTADTALAARIDSIEKSDVALTAKVAAVEKAAAAVVANPNVVTGSNAGTAAPLTLWSGTKAQYDAITTKDANTIYAVKP